MSSEVVLMLDNFSAKTEEQHDEELKQRSLHLIQTKRQVKKIAPIKLLLIAVAVIMISSVMIYSRVVLTELTEDANSYQTKISKLNTEYERLEAELEAKTSIKAITEAAEKDLGLSKIDSSQIEYVKLTDNDSVAVEKAKTTSIKNIFDRLADKISDLFM